ncbi:MAG: ACP phosphodiesterase [Pseudomonadales bacterium]|nr:ACP phosphodiesterase [Pseudomonadales bacterium]MDP6469858.1 ACP phosphodiesterase [Pseudomonadales bacterium]MDP6827540.1 ACP phosphodiesterase [Pseudomonadales bacterium]MDP6971328.1 ACP phosphodiesterase [Pseudomonadales bacterium]
MNFLAHCLIAANASELPEQQAGLIAGGLLGDFIKGPIPQHWPLPAQFGIRLHRRIDAYSNQHKGVRRSSSRFPPQLRRFAPVFVDVIADHLLTLDWARQYPQPIDKFSQHCYRLADDHRHLLAAEHARYLDWLVQNDLLGGYGNPEIVERGLKSITRRLKRSELDPDLFETLPNLMPQLAEDFASYFPDLITHAREFVREAS